MRTTQQFSVTLPSEMAQMVKSKVSSGEYASDSEVARGGLRALQSRGKALESWLLREVVPANDALKADPSRGQVRCRRAGVTRRGAYVGRERHLGVPHRTIFSAGS
jgi:antitoxin ParD1/3/4